MTLEEFISLDPKKIRRDKQLMQLFVDFYKAAFSLTPNCAGCVFTKGFDKLRRHAKKGEKTLTLPKNIIMEKTFTVKAQYRGKILTYKENGIVYRKYGNNLDEAFALKLVEHGKSEVFATLPKSGNPIKEIKVKSDSIEDMDWKTEVLPLYAELKEKTGKKALSRSKNDVIAFINENK